MPNQAKIIFSDFFLATYQYYRRVQTKIFSIGIAGAFLNFGKKSTITPPLRLSGQKRISIGSEVFIGPGSWLHTFDDSEYKAKITIGNRVSIVGACVISAADSIVIEDSVLMARNVYVSDHSHTFKEIGTPVKDQGIDKISSVIIREGAWIGENCVICPGVLIGKGSVIGANSLVNRDIPDYTIAAGSPVRIIKEIAKNK